MKLNKNHISPCIGGDDYQPNLLQYSGLQTFFCFSCDFGFKAFLYLVMKLNKNHIFPCIIGVAEYQPNLLQYSGLHTAFFFVLAAISDSKLMYIWVWSFDLVVKEYKLCHWAPLQVAYSFKVMFAANIHIWCAKVAEKSICEFRKKYQLTFWKS